MRLQLQVHNFIPSNCIESYSKAHLPLSPILFNLLQQWIFHDCLIMSHPDPKVEHVTIVVCPWVGLDFSGHLPRTCKAYIDIKTCLKNGYLNLHKHDNPKYSNTQTSTKNLIEFCLKTGHKPPEIKTQFISNSTTNPSMGYPNIITTQINHHTQTIMKAYNKIFNPIKHIKKHNSLQSQIEMVKV